MSIISHCSRLANNCSLPLISRTFSTGRYSLIKGSSDQYIANISHCKKIANQVLNNLSPYRNLEQFLKASALAGQQLPKELRSSLYDFKTYGNNKGYFIVRALPADPNLMDTPADLASVTKTKTTFLSEFWLSAVGSLLGEPYSYVQENNGNLFHNVRPAQEKADKLSSESSKVLLDLHSETAFHPFYPDFLLLYCLRSDRDKIAKTIVAPLSDIRQQISPHLESILRKPVFKTGIDFSFGNVNGDKGNGPVLSILHGDFEDSLIIFDPDLMEGLTEEANQAILELKALFDAKKQGVLLEEGDLLVVDNYRAVHGRNSFRAYYDGKDRWLQRIYITRDLQKANKMFGKKERIVSHSFNNKISV